VSTGRTFRPRRRGIASVLAMLFLALFVVLAMSMAVSSTSSVEVAALQHEGRLAYAAAESGLQFTAHWFAQKTDLPSSSSPQVEDDELAALWQSLSDHFVQLDGTANLEGQAVTADSTHVALPSIRLPVQTGSAYSSFQVTVSKQADARFMTVRSVGRYGSATRAAEMTFQLAKDRTILNYAVASRSAMVLSAGSQVEGDLYSTWGTYECNGTFVPSYVMESDCAVVGMLATHESQDTWNALGLGDQITGAYRGVAFNVPPFGDQFSADKFDTSRYKDPTAEIRPGVPVGALVDLSTIAPDRVLNNERYPPKEDGTPREHFDRPLYQNRTFDNIYIPTGYNPQFESCTFNRITYIDCDINVFRSTSNWREFNPELPPSQQSFSNTLPIKSYWKMGNYFHNSNSWPDTHSNNVIFTDCTFNGPVITNVPKDYFWTKNSLYFNGQTRFFNDYMPESTILAPNFNVNIGSFSTDDSDSRLSGIIVGGIVDIRGEAHIDGTILSMFFPDWDLGVGRAQYRTNIGFYEDEESNRPEDADGTVHIRPNPDRTLPMGIVTKTVVKPLFETYAD
jgi:Tfp pilus assembly protein PilX